MAEALAAARLNRWDDPMAEIAIGAADVELEFERRGHVPLFLGWVGREAAVVVQDLWCALGEPTATGVRALR